MFGAPQYFLALGFGSGLVPRAPGTAGSLCAIPIVWLMGQMEPVLYGAVCAACFLGGIWICESAGRHLGAHDHPSIVWDEIVGMQIALILVPVTGFNLLAGFLLFRFFDIVKPWPVRWVDRRVHGGIGVMMDDVLAGAMAALVLYGLSFV